MPNKLHNIIREPNAQCFFFAQFIYLYKLRVRFILWVWDFNRKCFNCMQVQSVYSVSGWFVGGRSNDTGMGQAVLVSTLPLVVLGQGGWGRRGWLWIVDFVFDFWLFYLIINKLSLCFLLKEVKLQFYHFKINQNYGQYQV